MRKFWDKYSIWIPTAAALVVSALLIILAQSAMNPKPTPRVQAEPPVEREVTFDMEVNRAYTADDGIIVIPAMAAPATASPLPTAVPVNSIITDSPENVWRDDGPVHSRNYTLPELAQMPDGSIGVLTIPRISLSVGVYEAADEMEAMEHGLAHFNTTSAWIGNVGLAGHNLNFDLTDGFFKHLHTLKPGDTITYQTALGIRQYTVETVAEIAETDWSYLGRTDDNRITMITCISGKPSSRLVVQCVAI